MLPNYSGANNIARTKGETILLKLGYSNIQESYDDKGNFKVIGEQAIQGQKLGKQVVIEHAKLVSSITFDKADKIMELETYGLDDNGTVIHYIKDGHTPDKGVVS